MLVCCHNASAMSASAVGYKADHVKDFSLEVVVPCLPVGQPAWSSVSS